MQIITAYYEKLSALGFTRYIKSLITIVVALAVITILLRTAKSIVLACFNKKFRDSAILLKIKPQNGCDIIKTEQLLMYLHGLLLNTKWRVWTGGQPYLSYEVVAKYKKIEFYVWIPARYKKILEEQIYICYPDCVVETAEDYMIPLKIIKQKIRELKKKKKEGKYDREIRKLQIHGMELELGLNYAFPIAEKIDIIDSILGTMTDLEWHEKIVLQIIIKPLDRAWQLNGRKIIKDYEKKGIHPDAKMGFGNFTNELEDLKKQFADELDFQLRSTNSSSKTNKKGVDNTRADREEMREASKKVIKSGFDVKIRIVGTGFYGRGIKDRVRATASAFNKVDYINRMKKKYIYFKRLFYKNACKRNILQKTSKNILTPGELGGFIFRFPDRNLSIKEIIRNNLIQLPPPIIEFEKKQNLLGNIIYKGSQMPFGLKPQDARRHIHVIGGIGVGKSEFLKRQFIDAVREGKGAVLMDPHGELSDDIVKLLAQELPEERLKDILFYDFSDSEYPVPFNFMQIYFDKDSNISRSDMIDETAEEFMNIMKQIFSDSWGIRTEKIFRHTGKALMEANEGGLWNAKQILKNREYRRKVISKIKNVAVKDFWETEFIEKQQKNGTYKLDSEIRNAIDSPLTKIDRFLSSERILNMVAQGECINFKECINDNKIVIFKIPKGILKEENTKFIGNIVFSKLTMAFMARSSEEMKQEKLILIDEVQNFVTTNPKSFENLLDELRKYGVQFVMAHQRVSQIEPIISAVMDNVGTTVCFRVGVESSKYMQRVFNNFLEASDLEQLENRYAYVRALVNGQKTDPFLIKTLDRYELDKNSNMENMEKIIMHNRQSRRPKEEIEKELKKKLKEIPDQIDSDFKLEVDDDYINTVSRNYKNESILNKEEEIEMLMPEEWQ